MFSPSAPLTLSLAAAWTFCSLSSLVGTCWADADQRLVAQPEGLHLHVADAELVELVAQVADVDRRPPSTAPRCSDPPLKSTP